MTRQYKIGNFLKRIKNQIDIRDSVKYKRVTVSGNHKGVSLRDEVLGSAIGTKKQFTIKGGNFILSKIDARNGAFGIIPVELDNAIITGNFWTYSVDTNLVDIEWFFYFTHSYNFIQICIESSTGSTHRKYMNEKVFLNHKIILPEIDEQKEMVKKYKTSSKISNSLTSEIQTQKHLLTQLKQSILQEAIQGKLTADWREQNPNTEPASELLKRIKSEKNQLIKDKKIKREKALPPITEEEIPFGLPEGWVWCRGYYVADYIDPQPSHRTPPVSKEGIPYVSMKDINKEGEITLHSARKVGKQILKEHRNRYTLIKGDFIFGKIGTIGNPVWLTEPFDYTLSANLILIQANRDALIPEYYFYFLSSPHAAMHLKDSKSEMSYPVFGMKKARLMPVILPPIEEQRAIVEKVESLMQKCQALEQEIERGEANAQMLMQVVLKEAFEVEREVVEV